VGFSLHIPLPREFAPMDTRFASDVYFQIDVFLSQFVPNLPRQARRVP
jgi:hypothetical protein